MCICPHVGQVYYRSLWQPEGTGHRAEAHRTCLVTRNSANGEGEGLTWDPRKQEWPRAVTGTTVSGATEQEACPLSPRELPPISRLLLSVPSEYIAPTKILATL